MLLAENGTYATGEDELFHEVHVALKEVYNDVFCPLSDASGEKKCLLALTNADVQSGIMVEIPTLLGGEPAASVTVFFPFTLRLADKAHGKDVREFFNEANHQLRATRLRFGIDAASRPLLAFAPVAVDEVCESVDRAISASEIFAPYILRQMFGDGLPHADAVEASVKWAKTHGASNAACRVKKHPLHSKSLAERVGGGDKGAW